MNPRIQIEASDSNGSRHFRIRIEGVGNVACGWWFDGQSFGERAKPHLDVYGNSQLSLADTEVYAEAMALAVDKLREWQSEYEKEIGGKL